MDYAIRVEGLTSGYDHPVISDISFSLHPGEILSVIGPNGAGKSTLLKSIARQLSPMAGTVFLDGHEMHSLSSNAFARTLSVVLTGQARPELTRCRDVVAMGRYPYTGRLGLLTPEDQAIVTSSLQMVGALDLAQREFLSISDGQRQRILLARAICQQPKIIVLDEPTSYLDLYYKLELLDILRQMATQGLSIIMSMHEIDLAQKASDLVLCMKDGAAVAFGTPEEIFTESRIRDLYGLARGTYDPLFGSVELPGSSGTPEALVLSSGATGTPVYRTLQRKGVPFAAGILTPGDADFRIAHSLATRLFLAEPYMPPAEAVITEMLDMIRSIPRVLDTGIPATVPGIQQLIDAARARNVYERIYHAVT
ncbi:MAG: ABC transporter ATP-binding protein [Clostridia bacterium]|nr:ABC transporter ATP-binding protein [Clostridia bacterium]